MSASKESRGSGELARYRQLSACVELFSHDPDHISDFIFPEETHIGDVFKILNYSAKSWAREREKKLRESLQAAEEALCYALGFMKDGFIECHGNKCRLLNCMSCNGEDLATPCDVNIVTIALTKIREAKGE